jgi:hypothetical protein
MKLTLLDIFATYGLYIQQKGRPMADAYLKQNNVDPATSAMISSSYNEKGKIINANGSAYGMMDLMKFKALI